MFLNLKQSILGRWLTTLLALVFVFQLAGCGDKEPRQRSAFIIFLQTEIVNKNRTNLPVLTKEQSDSFGDYTKQYQLLVDFNDAVKAALTPLASSLPQLQSMASIKDMLDNRDKIQETFTQLNSANTKLKQLTERIEKQKAELVQPEDLKAAFDRTYEKVVTQQLVQVKEGVPLLLKLFSEALELIDFVNSKGDAVRISTTTVEFSNPDDLNKFNALNTQMQKTQTDYLSFVQKGK